MVPGSIAETSPFLLKKYMYACQHGGVKEPSYHNTPSLYTFLCKSQSGLCLLVIINHLPLGGQMTQVRGQRRRNNVLYEEH